MVEYLNIGPMSVILYQDENNKTKIASTLFEPKINTQAIFESNTDQLKEKFTNSMYPSSHSMALSTSNRVSKSSSSIF